jgi:hypothetical protein
MTLDFISENINENHLDHPIENIKNNKLDNKMLLKCLFKKY